MGFIAGQILVKLLIVAHVELDLDLYACLYIGLDRHDKRLPATWHEVPLTDTRAMDLEELLRAFEPLEEAGLVMPSEERPVPAREDRDPRALQILPAETGGAEPLRRHQRSIAHALINRQIEHK